MSEQPAGKCTEKDGDYKSWLVRLWREQPQSPWRLQVTDVTSRKSLVFEDLESYIEFLSRQMSETP